MSRLCVRSFQDRCWNHPSQIASDPWAGPVRMDASQVKLQRRDPVRYEQTIELDMPDVHPLFDMLEGDIAE